MRGESDRILSFLMTDIQGSTKLWEAHPAAMPAVIAQHEALVAAAVAAVGGRLVKSRGEGDSTFSVFEHSTAAIACAPDVLDRIAGAAWPEEIVPRMRLAVHAGEASARESDFYGSTINRCARLREVANPGQILASLAACELANADGHFEFVDLGVHRLRDLLRPERIYQVGGRHDSFEPLQTLSAIRSNLPPQMTTFVGRRNAFKELDRILASNRLATIVGTGGCGKTRLALQFAADRQTESPDGVWFLDLRPLNAESDLASSVAAILGASSDSGSTSCDQLALHLNRAPRQTLILDNAEHIIASVQALTKELMLRTTATRFLVTSRESLRVSGEVVYRIPTLELPEPGQLDPKVLAEVESVNLFLDRARLRRPEFEITERNAAAIAQICTRLDGLPLAIEPVAALTDVLSPNQIAQRLDDRFRLLQQAEQAGEIQIRTILAAIEWSYTMLSAEQQLLLHRLTAFPATFASDSVESVCCGGAIERDQVLRLLRDLAHKSMIASVHTESETRFRLLELVHEFLSSRPLNDDFRPDEGMLSFAKQVAKEGESAIGHEAGTFWLEKLDWEMPTIRNALAQSFESDPVSGAELAYAMRRYWFRRGQLNEGRIWLERSVSLTTALEPLLRADLLNAVGVFAWGIGDLASAVTYLESSAEEFERLGETARLPGVRINIAIVLDAHGRSGEATEAYLAVIETLRSGDEGQLLWNALLNVSLTQRKTGALDAARLSASEALSLAIKHADLAHKAIALASLAGIEIDSGNVGKASQHAVEALEIWQPDPAPTHVADLFCKCCLIAVRQRDSKTAQWFRGAAERILEENRITEPDELRETFRLIDQDPGSSSSPELALSLRDGRSSNIEMAILAAQQFCRQNISFL